MHPARLSYLAVKHKQRSTVTARYTEPEGGTRLTLSCGHEAHIAPHFDASQTREVGCFACGEKYVKTAPQYASEFCKE